MKEIVATTQRALAILSAGLLATACLAQDSSATQAGQNTPPPHTSDWPGLTVGKNKSERAASMANGVQLDFGMTAKELLDQRRKLDSALGSLQPQRPGTVDAYVITIALDSDPVFAREAREAGKVLARRYDADGRTIVLAGPDGKENSLPRGSINSLLITLAHVGELMDAEEDTLVLYTTSHGVPEGLTYHWGDTGFGVLSPAQLKGAMDEAGITRRIALLSACYSGVFIPALTSPDTAILTASAGNRSSFGCAPDNDWTFFGDALINRALRKPISLQEASREANLSVAQWESKRRLLASLPQTIVGANVSQWLPQLAARRPLDATQPVGKPAAGD